MPSTEFQLIRRFFKSDFHRADVHVGMGDDAAVLQPKKNADLVWSVDSLVADVHFRSQDSPRSVGHKALAVNLSDMAAMGAEPCWVSLAVHLPRPDDAWLEEFCRGFFDLAYRYQLELVGGDTCQGPLSVTVNIAGWVPTGKALLRSGAKPGDRIFISGHIGAAGLALRQESKHIQLAEHGELYQSLHWPQPRVELGLALRDVASAVIDISDGLAADLQHILEQSQVGASVQLDQIPMLPEVRDHVEASHDWSLPLTSGDDYELCFTIPETRSVEFEAKTQLMNLPVHCIGEIRESPGLEFLDGQAQPVQLSSHAGYEHFKK